MTRTLLAVTICFIFGVLANSLLNVSFNVLIYLTSAFFLFALAGYVLFRKETAGVILVLFGLLGWLVAGLEFAGMEQGPARFSGHYVTLEGTVTQEPRQLTGEEVVYVLAAEAVYPGEQRVNTTGLVQVKVKGGGPVYGYGDRLRVGGFIYLPREPGNFGAFNYRAYLERRGIKCLMTVKGPEYVRLLAGGGGNPLVRTALRCKRELTRVAGDTLDERQAAVLSGMLFGSRDMIDRSTSDLFAQTGVAHVLCASGLHVGFVLAGMLLVAGALGLTKRELPFVALPVLIFYAVMTGMGPAVIRASIMALVVLWAVRLGRERDWPTALALAASGILLFKPHLLFEIGFQLSFAATWGILYLGPPLGGLLFVRWSLPRWLGLPLQVTLAAQLGTLPLLVYYFNLLTPVAPLANLLLVPMVGLIMMTGFVGCVTGLFFMPGAELAHVGTGLLIDMFLGLADVLGSIPWGATYAATPPWPVVLLWYAGLFFVVETVRGRINPGVSQKVLRVVPMAAAALMALLILWPWGDAGGRMQVHFLDVGQGDSILVRFPGGGTMLVDAGGWPGGPEENRLPGDLVVVPYLHRLGINSLDALVVTHGHEDHAGGVPAVVEKLAVKTVILSCAGEYRELPAFLKELQVPVHRAGAGQALRLDDRVDVLVLHPGRHSSGAGGDNQNDASLVLRLEYGDISFLLTGDIEEPAQKELLAGGAELRSNLLKVPHHGSRFFKSGFFETVSPEVAVIQVGDNNRFGHPAPETLAALRALGARVLSTDRDGAVLVVTDGEELTVRTAKNAPIGIAH
ncbi:MAG: DNA internalization-related competence protein ComEC/Rec2 [Firmicutes bacterium]|nr:DNA internalization-related competence protein ComEC/Rec2 [Bacillota bacterium]